MNTILINKNNKVEITGKIDLLFFKCDYNKKNNSLLNDINTACELGSKAVINYLNQFKISEDNFELSIDELKNLIDISENYIEYEYLIKIITDKTYEEIIEIIKIHLKNMQNKRINKSINYDKNKIISIKKDEKYIHESSIYFLGPVKKIKDFEIELFGRKVKFFQNKYTSKMSVDFEIEFSICELEKIQKNLGILLSEQRELSNLFIDEEPFFESKFLDTKTYLFVIKEAQKVEEWFKNEYRNNEIKF